jgi:hypothetical protein
MVEIMGSVLYHSKSFDNITKDNSNIPRTTAFRKIKWLVDEGLLIVDKIVITQSVKKFSFYHSTLKAINVKYENNDVFVEAEPPGQ